jgi:hypothetical protein
MTNKVKRTERGWPGHFICSTRCVFRRNTLLEYDDIKIVVSTVGNLYDSKGQGPLTLGRDYYYETKVFHANKEDTRYYGADVKKEIILDSNWNIKEKEKDDLANEMHERIVNEISEKLEKGEKFEVEEELEEWEKLEKIVKREEKEEGGKDVKKK